MNFIKQLKLRYHVYKSIQTKLFIVREYLQEMNRVREYLRNDPDNDIYQRNLTDLNKELDKWKASLGHSVLLFIGEFGPLKDDGFDPEMWHE